MSINGLADGTSGGWGTCVTYVGVALPWNGVAGLVCNTQDTEHNEGPVKAKTKSIHMCLL